MRSSDHPREMLAAAIEAYLAFLEADPEVYRFVVHTHPGRPADGDPISHAVRPRRRPGRRRRRRRARAGRRRPRPRRALGPRPRRAGPLGRRLVAARRPPHAPRRPRRPPDRSRLGRALRRRGNRDPRRTSRDQHPAADRRPDAIQEVLDGRWAHVRRDARENLDDPEFLPVYGESVAEARERVTRATKKLADSGRAGLGFPKEYGGEADAGALGHLVRDAGLRRPVADGQGRRPVGPVRRRGPAARHRAPPRRVPARHRRASSCPAASP